MKNLKKKMQLFSLIGMCVIIGSIFQQTGMVFFNNNENAQIDGDRNEIFLKKSKYWPNLNRIIIDNNWTATNQTYSWCNGAGSKIDPYVIENVTINADGAYNGILINNSNNAYFIIRNCTIYNSGENYTDPYNFDSGIHLVNTSKGMIINSNLSNNQLGIYLYKCNEIDISGIIASYNTRFGVYLAFSENNSISGAITNNNDYGIMLEGSSYNNITGGTSAHNTNHGMAIWFDSYGNKIWSNILQDNKYGLGIAWSGDNLVYNNTFLNNWRQDRKSVV